MFKDIIVLRYFFLFFLFLSLQVINAQTNDIEIPNVFTPNGDQINDFFVADGLTGQWDMNIYDRWGTLVFASEDASGAGWDGHNILGLEAGPGVYFYIIKKKDAEDFFKGTIHLFR